MLRSIRLGFSIRDFMRVAKWATVAPSSTRWSALMLKLTACAGTKSPSSSRYFAKVWALPIAIIAHWGLRMVGTK